jgi:lambda family phage tail tape measure protein
MSLVSRLGVVLGLDSAEFSAGLGKAEGDLNKFSGGMGLAKIGIAALGTALIGAASQALQFANDLTELAQANDLSVATTLELSAALSTSGGHIDNTGKILSAFTRKVDEAAQGSQSTRDKFKELGISLSDLGKLSEEDLLRKTIEGLSKIEDPIHRNALAFETLGKGIRGVDLKSFNHDLDAAKGTYDKSEEAFAKIQIWGDKIAKSWFDAKVAMANYVVALADSVDKNKKLMQGVNAYSKGFYGTPDNKENANNTPAETVVAPVIGRDTKASDADIKRQKASEKVRDAMLQQSLEFERQIKLVGQVQTNESKLAIEFEKGGKYVGEQNTQLGKRLIAEAKALDLAKLTYAGEEAIKKVLEEHQILREKANEQGRLALEAVIEKREAERETFDLATQDVQIAAERLRYEKELAGLSDTQRQKALEFFDLSKQMKRMADTNVGLDSTQLADRQKAEQDRIFAEEENARAQNTFQAGWDKAFANYKEKAMDSASIAADAFNSMASSMESALDTFVSTGKFSFSSLAQSIIQDLIKIQLKAQMMSIFGGGGSGGGLFSMFGDMLGSAPLGEAGTGSGILGALSGIFHFADGGSPPVGVPSLVGERGAELFVPKTAGTIIPNNQLSSMMGNQPQTIYNGTVIQNMQAIDTQSATQFLAKNKQAVWSANMSQQRSMPQNR